MKEFDSLRLYLPSAVVKHVEERIINPGSRTGKVDYHIIKCVVLFADVSGFTSLTQSMYYHDKVHGMELLAKELNKYLTQIVKKITRAGGDVLKFAGDAILALWPLQVTKGKELTQVFTAAQCAVDIQEYVTSLDETGEKKSSFNIDLYGDRKLYPDKTPEDNPSLFVKFGLGYGDVRIMHIGGESDNRVTQRFEYFSVGNALQEAFNCEGLCAPGETIASEEIYKRVKKGCEFDPEFSKLHPKYHKLLKVKNSQPWKRDVLTVREKYKRQLVKKLWTYVPASVMLYLLDATNAEFWMPEIRRVTSLFVSVSLNRQVEQVIADATPNAKALDKIQQVFRSLQASVYQYQGTINKFSYDDKGCTLVVVFGLPPIAHDNDSDRGVLCALAMMDVFDEERIDGACGITTGDVFTGIVGHGADRREYTVLGHSVNIAARLMQEAGKDTDHRKIYVDLLTKLSVREDIPFADLERRKLKGITEAVKVFCVETKIGLLDGLKDLHGEEKEAMITLGSLHVATLKRQLKQRGTGGRFIRRKPNRKALRDLGETGNEVIKNSTGQVPGALKQKMKNMVVEHNVVEARIHYSKIIKEATKENRFAEFEDRSVSIAVERKWRTLGDIKFELTEKLPDGFDLKKGYDISLAYYKPVDSDDKRPILGRETVNLGEGYSLLRFPPDQTVIDLRLTQSPPWKRPVPEKVKAHSGKDIYSLRDKLEDTMDDFVLNHRGGVVMVEGPHGVGKTYTIAQTVLVENTMNEVLLASGNLYETGGDTSQHAFSICWTILNQLLNNKGAKDAKSRQLLIVKALEHAADVYEESFVTNPLKGTQMAKKEHMFNETEKYELNRYLGTNFEPPRTFSNVFQTIATKKGQAQTMKKIIFSKRSGSTMQPGQNDFKVKSVVKLICAIVAGLSTEENKTVIFVDNTHEMDPYSWLVVEELAQYWTAASVLVILGYRTGLDLDDPISMDNLNNRVSVVRRRGLQSNQRSSMLADELQLSTKYIHAQLKQIPQVKCYEVLPVPEFTESIICDIFSVRDVPKELVEYLTGAAKGNVLYVRDAIQQYLENDLIKLSPDKNSFVMQSTFKAQKSAGLLPIPVSVINSFSEQIDSLSVGQQVALKVASVIWNNKLNCLRLLKLKGNNSQDELTKAYETALGRAKDNQQTSKVTMAHNFIKVFGSGLSFTLGVVRQVYPLKTKIHQLANDWIQLEDVGIIQREARGQRLSKQNIDNVRFEFRMQWMLQCLENRMLKVQKKKILGLLHQITSRRIQQMRSEELELEWRMKEDRIMHMDPKDLEYEGVIRIAKFKKGGYKRRYCVMKDAVIVQYDSKEEVGNADRVKGKIFLDSSVAEIRTFNDDDEKRQFKNFNKRLHHLVVRSDKWEKLGDAMNTERDYTLAVEGEEESKQWFQRIGDQIIHARLQIIIDNVTPADFKFMRSDVNIKRFFGDSRGMLNTKDLEKYRQRLDPNLLYSYLDGTSIAQRKDNKIQGYIIGYISPHDIRQAIIHVVAVDYELRRKGIGRALHDEFFDLCKREGCQTVRTILSRDADDTISFHKKMGFKEDVAETNRITEMGGNVMVFVKEIMENIWFVKDDDDEKVE